MAVFVLPLLGLAVAEGLAPAMGRFPASMLVGAGAGLATVVLGYLLWRLILSPVRALTRRAEAIRRGDDTPPLPRYGTPEVGELGQVVLDMAASLKAREMAVRGYADHVTHELKTPLSAIRGAAELLEADPYLSDEAKGLVATIRDAEGRAEDLLTAAQEVVRARVPEHRGEANVAEAIERLDLPADVEVELFGGRVPVPIADDGLALMLGHLMNNAVAAGATRVSISTADENDRHVLRFADNGTGISDGNAERVFDPFFTTRRAEGGTGMGLAIVRTLLHAHGADIALEQSGAGASFRIVW